MTIDALAVLATCDRQTVRSAIAKGCIPGCRKILGRYVIPDDSADVEAWATKKRLAQKVHFRALEQEREETKDWAPPADSPNIAAGRLARILGISRKELMPWLMANSEPILIGKHRHWVINENVQHALDKLPPERKAMIKARKKPTLRPETKRQMLLKRLSMCQIELRRITAELLALESREIR